MRIETKYISFRLISLSRPSLNIYQLWVLIVIVASFIQLWTIGYLPQYQQDEVQITDYGRLALNPDSDWAATWLLQNERPLMLWSYLGPLVSEFGYQFLDKNGIGPRVVALLGGVFAATIMLFWLRQRKVPAYAALALSLGFLLDPFFVLSQRPARVDSWVIGFLLFSCYFLRRAASGSDKKRKYYTACAGAMVVIGTFIWPSSLFLYPLVGLEFLHLILVNKTGHSLKKLVFIPIVYFLIGAVVMSLLLLLPVWKSLLPLFTDLSNVVSLNVRSNQSITDRFLQLLDYDLWIKLFKAFIKTLSPLLPLFAILGAVYRKERGLVIATFAAITLIIVTLVYEFRILYLIPYLIALFGGIYERFELRPPSPLVRKVGMAALVLLIIWSAGISLLFRTVIAEKDKDILATEKLQSAAFSAIGPGNFKVFMANTYEFYYVGRSIGWKIYNLYPIWNYNTSGAWVQMDLYKPTEKFVNLLSRMDYAIFMENSISKEVAEDLAKGGLHFYKRITVNNTDKGFLHQASQSRSWNIVMGYLRGNKHYGAYVIYKRM